MWITQISGATLQHTHTFLSPGEVICDSIKPSLVNSIEVPCDPSVICCVWQRGDTRYHSVVMIMQWGSDSSWPDLSVYCVHYTADILHLVTLHSHTVTNQARCTCIHVDTYMFVMFTCVYVCIFTHMYMFSCAHCISAPLYMYICVSNSCDLFNHLYIHVHLTASLTPCFLLCNHIHSCVDVYVYMWQQYYHLLCNLITSLYVYMWL